MRINILGQLVVLDNKLHHHPTVPKPRQILALLVINADRIVPTSSLLRELWNGEPPRTAMTTVQTYIGQLRRLLAKAMNLSIAEVAERVLVTETGGYQLMTGDIAVDLADYVSTAERGKAAVRAGEDAEGAALLRAALDMWRGQALVDVEAGPLLQAQVSRLEESRLCTYEQLITAELRLGEHHDLISELVELTAARPLHESLHGHLMLALYRCGRRSEALAVFQTLRHRLVNDIGLEPSSELLRMQHAILTTDPVLNTYERELRLLSTDRPTRLLSTDRPTRIP